MVYMMYFHQLKQNQMGILLLYCHWDIYIQPCMTSMTQRLHHYIRHLRMAVTK